MKNPRTETRTRYPSNTKQNCQPLNSDVTKLKELWHRHHLARCWSVGAVGSADLSVQRAFSCFALLVTGRAWCVLRLHPDDPPSHMCEKHPFFLRKTLQWLTDLLFSWQHHWQVVQPTNGWNGIRLETTRERNSVKTSVITWLWDKYRF
jgi:hypothetical protein